MSAPVKAVLCGATRTAIGSFGGTLSSMPAAQLGATVIRDALQRVKLDPEKVDEVIMGHVLQAGAGQNSARQAALGAGLLKETPCMAINKVCGSGLKSVMLATQSVLLGDSSVVVAGGHENIAEKYGISRQEQDEFAARSQQRVEKAMAAGKFVDEIVPVEIPQRRGSAIVFDKDEFPKASVQADGLAKLRPAFKKDGSVTAANASGINDGAAAVVVTSEAFAKENGMEILAEVVAYASAGVDPSIMGMGPVPASQACLSKAGWTMDDVDLIEANEAFAAQALAVGKELGINPEKLNVNGGAISLGHPIGASGTRCLVTLLYEMRRREAQKGLVTLCIGGGQGVALAVQRPSA